MTKVDIISGFLGAGKTTLIKKLIAEGFEGEKLVLIENEFGEIGIDGGFLKDAGVQINEMNSGCICCSLVGDFGKALEQVLHDYTPDRIIIEPSGVGKLSDVMKAVADLHEAEIEINSASTVVDATKCKMYMKNFGEFFNNQVESAGTIILSRSQKLDDDKLNAVVNMLKEHNDKATVITTPWDDINGKQIVDAMEGEKSLVEQLLEEAKVCPTCGHVHEHGDECDHDHHHEHHDHDEHEHHHEHHDHDEHEHHHEHHDHDEHEHHHEHHDHDEHEHHHEHHDHDDHDHHHEHHDHDEHEHHHNHDCGCHDHDHHHHHHADDVFTSWGKETANKYTKAEIEDILKKLADSEDSKEYGIILRAKGMVPNSEGGWIYFDLTPEEFEVRDGQPDVTGKLCVIGSELKEDKVAELFRV
ncbi:MAG: cobalamin biosynthesis protein CobW [Lachnospiraceae bacterium]|jgi:G3E family GTPase|nr:cobalamin biosynthesis protein CobW [Lachnospiraceae bacterium]